jgi:leucyl/phenylalanyl-tRNA--protein transferase
VAVGGDLSVSRLLLAYSKGIFPWYEEPGEPHWYCPEERCVFHVPSFKPSKSLRSLYNKGTYTITFDQAFYDVVFKCSGIRFDNSPSDLLGDKRSDGTWILPEIIEAYDDLHQLGFAHSGRRMVGRRIVWSEFRWYVLRREHVLSKAQCF